MKGRILYGIKARVCFIKLIGEIRYTKSKVLDDIINRVLAEEKISEFVVDLRSTTFIDSTNLGILAQIARWSNAQNLKKSILLVNSEELEEVLKSIKFDVVFTIQDFYLYEDVDYELVEQEDKSDVSFEKFLEIVKTSHQTIMGMHHENQLKFQDVIELIMQDEEDMRNKKN